MQGQFNPMTGQMGDTWPMLAQLEQLFTVRTLTPDIDHIDKDVDVLMLVHPKQLPPKTLYAIDQFVMRGGQMLLFVDPRQRRRHQRTGSLESLSRPRWRIIPRTSSRCSPHGASTTIRPRWSAILSSDSRCAPACRRRRRAISGFSACAGRTWIRRTSYTASLDIINVATAGFLSPRPGAKTTFEPLLQSSNDAAPIPAAALQRADGPASLRDGFKPTGTRYAHRGAHDRTCDIGLSRRARRRTRNPPLDRRSPTCPSRPCRPISSSSPTPTC